MKVRSSAPWGLVVSVAALIAVATAVFAESPNSNPRTPGKPGAKSSERAAAAPAKPAKLLVSPAERRRRLLDLYEELSATADESAAEKVRDSIERMWVERSTNTTGVLIERAMAAINAKNYRLAGEILEKAVNLAPDDPEVFNRRAYLRFLENDIEGAVGDLRRTLALEPSHFKALEGLAQILRETGDKKFALAIYRRLLAIDPNWPNADNAVNELAHEVEGVPL